MSALRSNIDVAVGLVRVTFGRPRNVWWNASLGLCTHMGRAIARDQGVLGNGRAPENPACFRLKAVLMASFSFEEKGHVWLAPMRVTASLVGYVQTVRAWRDPNCLYAHPPIERLGIKPEEMERAWPYDQGIGLRCSRLWRWGIRCATEQPVHTTQQYQEPQAAFGRGVRSMGMAHSLKGTFCDGVVPTSHHKPWWLITALARTWKQRVLAPEAVAGAALLGHSVAQGDR